MKVSRRSKRPGKEPKPDVHASGEGLVRWQLLTEMSEAFVRTAAMFTEATASSVTRLLDRITAPHRLLEQLDGDADDAIAGDPLAARRLTAQFDRLAASFPTLSGSQARAVKVVASCASDAAEHGAANAEAGTLSFDRLVHLAVAAAMVTRSRPPVALDVALDVLLGLTLRTSAANRIVNGLATAGQPGVARAFNELRLTAHSLVAPVPLQTMGGGPIGIPSGPLGGLPGGPGHGRPSGPGDVPEFVGKLIAGLRDQYRWNPEISDQAPLWREAIGLAPIEEIDREELSRVRCMLALIAALKLRQEPPPPRPPRAVWSDTITGIEAIGLCPGDRVVIHGHGFGVPRAVGVMLPMADGCQAFPVPAIDWTDTDISITLPIGVASGPIGLVDLSYVQSYDQWAEQMNALTKSIIENAKCSRSKAPDVAYVTPFRECAPLTPVNRLRAGLPVIRAFKANGQDLAVVEPGQPVILEWDFANVDQFRLTRIAGLGPQFAGQAFADDPPNFFYNLGAFVEDFPAEAHYELRAVGPCGTVTARVAVLLRKLPVLQIVGVEVTQAIQTFSDPNVPPNSIPLVAQKDTIVRVYVAVENLGGFKPNGSNPDEVGISGEVRIIGTGPTLPPLRRAKARPSVKIERWTTDNTLNFRIPAGLASGSQALRITAWGVDEVETAPLGIKTRPVASPVNHAVTWIQKAPFKVRYVRISHDGLALISDQKAREVILRAFDLLATPSTDVAPARVPIWNTSLDLTTRDGISDLLGHIDDQHDCTFSEWLLPWEDECPDADGAVWVGVTSRTEWGGMAQGLGWFNSSRNTAIVPPERLTAAHEMGHTLSLNHVNPNVNSGLPFDDDTDFDTLPNGGAIQRGDAFDPAAGETVNGLGPGILNLYDFMSYAMYRWVSPANRQRVFDKF